MNTLGVQTEHLKGEVGLARAVDLLRSGHTVAFPTETVYGLGADATDGEAVAQVFAAKDRPSFNPLISHVATPEMAMQFVKLPPVGERLAQMFWPGPLTLVAPLREAARISDLANAGLNTMGVRVPAHPLAQELLARVGRPVAAPSANPSGRISPTSAVHVLEGLVNRIAAVFDGGNCTVGLESTIVGFQNGLPVLLRPGGLPIEDIEAVIGTVMRAETGAPVTAPGQLASHYAPSAAVVLDVVNDPMIGFGSVKGRLQLSASGDLAEAASRLFQTLRAADRLVGEEPITVAPIPNFGLGLAINDRLSRAAAPR